jgi:phthiocerol/phenolphthiocerol synthesis type-I polyketide synthase B
MGEVTAAVVAGALTAADGLRVIATRSRLMSRLAGQGAVALLELDATATETLIADHAGVAVAGYVSPGQTVIAGPPANVDAAIAAVEQRGRFARRVNMEVASHTELMDPILGELRAELADLTPAAPAVRFMSTVRDPETTPLLDTDYWVANVRQPVRLHHAFTAAAERHSVFVEISPHPMLTHAITETLGEARHHHSTGTLSRDSDDTLTFHTNLNSAHTAHPPDTPHPPEPHPILPATPWLHTSHWMDLTASQRKSVPSRPRRGSAQQVVPAEWNCELTWPSRPQSGDTETPAGSWLVVADRGLAAELSDRIGAAEVTVVDPESVPAALSAVRTADHVVYAPPMPTDPLDVAAAYRLFDTARSLVTTLAASPGRHRLFLVTRNAQPVSDGDRANPAHAVLWGLGRTVALEHPEIWGAVIDVDETVPDVLTAQYILTEAGSTDGEDQVVYRVGERRVPRLGLGSVDAVAPVGLDPNVSHLVVGATGNIGPHLVQQLADMGATTVVAVSRNPGQRLRELGDTLAVRGVTLVTAAADAADEDSMRAVFDRFGADLPPLGGIYLAAFGGGPVTLADMTDSDVAVMFTPKLDAVSVLHNLSLRHAVRHFVLFTSISGLIGSRWLAHYTATTTYLDTFAYARRAAGLPATAVNWGFWKSLADNQSDEYRQVTVDSGLEPMPDEVAIQALWSITRPDAPVRSTVVAADWSRLGAAYRTRAPLRIIDDLVPEENDDATAGEAWAGLDGLRELDPIDAERVIGERLCARLAAIMGYADPATLRTTVPLIELGIDSLLAVRIRQSIQADFGVEPPVGMLLQGGSVNDVAGDVMSQLGIAVGAGTADAVRDKANQRAAARRGAAVRRRRGQRA